MQKRSILCSFQQKHIYVIVSQSLALRFVNIFPGIHSHGIHLANKETSRQAAINIELNWTADYYDILSIQKHSIQMYAGVCYEYSFHYVEIICGQYV